MIAANEKVDAQPLVQLDLELSALTSDWHHCDQVANYLARIASFDRPDTFLYSNLLSTVLNELLEVVFFNHQPTGTLRCALLRHGATDRIEVTVPVDARSREFYERGVAEAQSPSVSELYTSKLLTQEPLDRAVGFLELAADYGAQISLAGSRSESELTVRVDVRLEEGKQISPAAA